VHERQSGLVTDVHQEMIEYIMLGVDRQQVYSRLDVAEDKVACSPDHSTFQASIQFDNGVRDIIYGSEDLAVQAVVQIHSIQSIKRHGKLLNSDSCLDYLVLHHKTWNRSKQWEIFGKTLETSPTASKIKQIVTGPDGIKSTITVYR